MGSRPVIGNLWVAKDENNKTYMRGYLFLTVKGKRRVYVTKVLMNKSKTLPTQPDFTVFDYTEGTPKIIKSVRRTS